MGLPEDWKEVELWLYCKRIESLSSATTFTKKAEKASEDGISVDWSAFKKKEIPSTPETRINVEKLEEMVKQHEN